ncbi:MAG: GTP diphosphokinase [Pseudomonadales bacterium]
MVRVSRTQQPEAGDGFQFEAWYAELELPGDAYDASLLKRAVQLSAEVEIAAGESDYLDKPQSSFRIGLQMAEILVDFKVDSDAFVAALLYRQVRKERLSLDTVQQEFGEAVSALIYGVQRMAMISQISDDPTLSVLGQGANQGQAIRKMLVSMVDDVRIALLKLVERTAAIRVAKLYPERRTKIAREVFNVYVPLAHRLGIGQLKWELEDLSFRYLEPDVYQQIAGLLAEKRVDRESFINAVTEHLGTALSDAGIDATISGRAKHIFSIWRKMRSKSISFSEVYDIRGVRILVKQPHDCYAVLGIVHLMWRSVPNEFDDYIANPKENGYRSLHTAVLGPEGNTLEVQIRTEAMHMEAEYGVCAHWLYKGSDAGKGSDTSYEEKIAWLREVLQWSADMQRSEGRGRKIRSEIVNDRVYVFTPEGHIVDLPSGATPIDFAYHVHTEIGHRCKGAKIDGRIVPLTYQLHTGEQIEIITGNQFAPNRDWLRDGLSYTRTARARSKIRQWFKRLDQEENVAAGRQLVEREFKRLALTSLDYSYVARKVNCQSVESMYGAIGAGDIGLSQVLNAAQSLLGTDDKEFAPRLHQRETESVAGGVRVGGIGNLLSHLAGCCKPVPGDPIRGYITQGRGVSIHRQDCGRVLSLLEKDAKRIIEVDWDGAEDSAYPVEVRIEAFDRRGLLSDVTGLLAAEKCNLTQVQTHTDKQSNIARIVITVEVDSLESLGSLLAKINMLPNVSSAERILNG